MSEKRLRDIRHRLDNARRSHPAGRLPAMGDLQALQECIIEIDRLREQVRLLNLKIEKLHGHECIEPGCSETAAPYCLKHRGDWMGRLAARSKP